MMVAAGFCWPAILSLLLDQGATVDEQDEDGYTALMYCAVGGHVGDGSLVSKLLLDAGADATLTNLAGESYATLSGFAARVATDMEAQRCLTAAMSDQQRLRLLRARQRLALAKILPKKFWACAVEGSLLQGTTSTPGGSGRRGRSLTGRLSAARAVCYPTISMLQRVMKHLAGFGAC